MFTKTDELRMLMKHCNFRDCECYILSIIARKKNNSDFTHSNKIVKRKAVYDETDLCNAYEYLIREAENDPKHSYYMYVSVNPRNVKKALLIYNTQIVEMIAYLGNDSNDNRIKKLPSLWLSTLEKQECRGKERHFLIDIDTKDSDIYISVVNYIKPEHIILSKETKNGHHLIVKPMYVNKFESFFALELDEGIITLKKDELLFVQEINGE